MLRRDSARERDVLEHARFLHDKRQMAIERASNAGVAPTPRPPSPARAASPVPAAAPPVRVLTLNHGEHLDSTIFRFEKGTVVQFCPGPSLLGRKVFVYTNYVVTDNPEEKEVSEFVRSQYYLLDWRAPSAEPAGSLALDTDQYCELRLARAGAFHYYFVYDNAESPVGPAGSGWLQVPPTLAVGEGARERLAPEDVSCVTVLTKCLGPLARWESTLRVVHEAGYNMIHFTPIQMLGGSNSSYSLADQMRLDPRLGADASFADVERLVGRLRGEWRVASICDVVLNHTANETPWLADHPEATYNCANCPRLRPAALLDAALARVTRDAARGELAARGIPPAVSTHEHIEAVRRYLAAEVLPALRLHELFACDVPALLQQFLSMARNKLPAAAAAAEEPLALAPDPLRRRRRAAVDLERALRLYNVQCADARDEEARLRRCADALRRRLEDLNDAAAREMDDHLRHALDNCVAGMRYFRLQADGPKIEEVSEKNPLVPRYFTGAGDAATAAEAEALVFGAGGRRVMAHNGWVMDADPLQDFAATSHVYLRRELIAWGDSVKLRYGARPEDSPWLWAHMRRYVERTAETFDGLRLDNCHSTPLPVAEYLVDAARNVRPDLFVAAELFTNSDLVDNIFFNRLGITVLIREAQAAWDAREQGRLLHRFGGRPVGAFLPAPRAPAAPGTAPALLLDLSHDNPCPLARRSVHDALPTAALVAAAACAAGSTRGLDELVPHAVHVVDEARLYPAWDAAAAAAGLLAARRELHALRAALAAGGFREIYVDQLTPAVTAVTRHSPRDRRSVLLVAHTAFAPPAAAPPDPPLPPPLRFEAELDEILFEMELEHRGEATYAPDPHVINGLPEWAAAVRRRVPLASSSFLRGARREGAHTVLEWRAFPPGAVLALRLAPPPAARAALPPLQRLLAAADAGEPDALGLAASLAPLDLADLNALLYRCDAEERAANEGGGVYEVPGHGPLVYAGLQGAASLLADVRAAEDLGHALCENLRAGDWLLEYTWRRLRAPRLQPVAARLRELFAPLAELPRYLLPAHAEALLRHAHAAAEAAALARLAPWCRSSALARGLALCSVQLAGAVPDAWLPAPSPALPPPRPPPAPASVTLSAGLPHFAVGYMRCWGRDTFVALRGTFLLTGRHQDARAHILGFAACLRHGLIPNLLDGGRNARFNCRDAVWWWLHAIKQYVEEAPQGAALLADPVSRLFPRDDSEPAPPGAADQPLADVMQEALEVHFQGLVFRERNAGRQIDAHMSDKGFNVQIGVDPDTGFPFGGNDANCGTWMDKMGSSDKAGTRGRPATPRDGSAVELVALAYSAAAWLAALHRAGRFPHAGVARRHADGALTSWTYAQWAERIHRNFERYFWVPAAPSAADLRPDLVHRRAIYKDCHGASQPWADYQLRCNAVVAMAVAPELFDPKHAWLALDQTERLLLGPLGLKTLDPADWNYRPEYDNSNASDDASVAHGFNYHQGPEWTWPLGFYLRARLAFAHDAGRWARTAAAATAALAAPAAELRASPWRGLPELTGPGGAPCRDACRSQAWSSGALLEALHALEAARRARPLPPD